MVEKLFKDGEFLEFVKKELTIDKLSIKVDEIEDTFPVPFIVAGYVLGAKKNNNNTFVLDITDLSPEEYGKVVGHYAVKALPGKDKEDGNFVISVGFGEYVPTDKKEVVVHENIHESDYVDRIYQYMIRNLSKKLGVEWIKTLIVRYLLATKKFLEENVTDEELKVVIPGVAEYSITPEKVLSITADQEIKKRLKSDAMVEEKSEDKKAEKKEKEEK
jgi:hypothetical protein